MIKKLSVENFKSIKKLDIECGRINVFVGEPNSGKSNILESLAFFSFLESPERGTLKDFKDFVRLESMSDLFYDRTLDEEVTLKADEINIRVKFENGIFICSYKGEVIGNFDDTGQHNWGFPAVPELQFFKYYTFKIMEKFSSKLSNFLLSPYGENLPAILLTRKDLKQLSNKIFKKFGFRLMINPTENKIDIIKEQEENIFIAYPYHLTSDTLQRVIFYLAAIKSNANSTLIFEEPEAKTFPYYTKYLAETIALDEKNQYFISTHNPYMLLSVLEKAKKGELNVFLVYFEDYRTKVRKLSDKEITEVMDEGIDLFLNLEMFIERFKK